MLAAIKALPAKSIVLLHPCCHNPTGVDLSREQWTTLIPVLAQRQLIPFLDIAYQGFGDNLDDDAFAIRAMVEAGLSFFVSNSFSTASVAAGCRWCARMRRRPCGCSGN
jgi:aromatic-amino-acid transaminase